LGYENDHSACVHAWMKRAAKDLAPEPLIQAFQLGFGALWQRAHRTLGDVTVAAIADRVLYTAAEQFPFLSSLRIEGAGIGAQELRERAGSLDGERLAEGIRFVLVEFLTVLGNLTAEILTPALHSELSKLAARGGRLSSPEQGDEGAKS
jgi:hypothetical protein